MTRSGEAPPPARGHPPETLAAATALNRRVFLAIAAAAYAGVFGAFVFVETPGLGLGHFFYIPVALLALAGGTRFGLLGGVIPFLLFNRAIARVPAVQASLILVLVPVVGAGASVLLLAERLSGVAVSGGLLALAGAGLAALRADDEPSTTEGSATPTADPPASDDPPVLRLPCTAPCTAG